MRFILSLLFVALLAMPIPASAQNEPSSPRLVINEVMVMNIDQFVDPSYNYGGWIEVYNPTSESISLLNCYVTEHQDNLTQHKLRRAKTVPAGGYYTIWFDHFSTNTYPTQVDFKLNTGGGWIGIVSSKGELLAETTYPAAIARTSWARTTDGGDEWGITAQPTPGATNNTSSFATKRLAAPEVDVEGQLFTSPVTIQATWPKGATLRYTTDGSAPTATHGETSDDGIFTFDNGYNTLRLCAIQDGMLPSPVVTNTYIYKKHDFTIPVLAVSGTDNDFFSDKMGIFVKGTNGIVAGGESTAWNVFQDWDRPATFELFAPTGERLFRQDVDVTPAGGWTRTTNYGYLHTSFKLKASKVYEGLNSMDYPFFTQKPRLKHKVLQIRNGGNDFSRFKDAALQQIVLRSGLYIDCQAYQPVIHYINGRYGCVFNMREPNNRHHGYANYGYDTDHIDQFELSSDKYNQMSGTRDTFNMWYSLATQCEQPATYKYICDELVDIDEFANYMAVGIWLGNNDWITNTNNLKAYRSTEGGGRFHFVLFDTEQSFATTTMLQNIENMGSYNEEIATLWKNMLRNDQFRKKFVDALCLVSGSVFEPKRCEEVLQDMYNVVKPMMDINNEGWRVNDTYNNLRSTLGGNGSRRSSIINNARNYSRLYNETREPISITLSSNVPHAAMLYNDMDVPTGRFTGRAFLPVTLTACPPAGYDFEGWRLKGATSVNSTQVFGNNEEWQYYDQGSLDGVNWTAPNYDADGWYCGPSPLGYDTKFGDMWALQNTHIEYGSSSSNKYPTYYFRKSFTLDQTPGAGDVFTLNYTLDDGCIVYVNGVEAGRDNMPLGNVYFNSYSSTYDYKSASMTIPASLLHKGANVIAVEVHNNNSTSTDIFWEGALYLQETVDNKGDLISTAMALELDSNLDGTELIASYKPHEPTSNEAQLPPVRINEVSAANATYANEYFKRNDWIELYNTTGEDIDIAGMYLTDNVDKPQKYQVPTQLESGVPTVIPAHGYMIVWCDKLAPLSQQHASFKLAAEEASVMLTAADGSWYDYLNYPAHNRYYTAGRYPDGTDDVYLMTTHTPAAANQLSSYSTAYELGVLDNIATTPTNTQGDLCIAYDGHRIVTSCMAHIEIYTVSGEMIMSVPCANALNLDTVRSGVYVARAKSGSKTAVIKFVKK